VFNLELGLFSLVNLSPNPFSCLKDTQYNEIPKNYIVDLNNPIEIKITEQIFFTVTPDLIKCSNCSNCICDMSHIFLHNYIQILCSDCGNTLSLEKLKEYKKLNEILKNIEVDCDILLEEYKNMKQIMIEQKTKEYDSLLNLVKKEIRKVLEEGFDKHINLEINEEIKNFSTEFKQNFFFNNSIFLEKRIINEIRNYEERTSEIKLKIKNLEISNQVENCDESLIISEENKFLIENISNLILNQQKSLEDYKISNLKTNIPFVLHGSADETLTIEEEMFNLRLNEPNTTVTEKEKNRKIKIDRKSFLNDITNNKSAKKNSSRKYNNLNYKEIESQMNKTDLSRKLDLTYEINFDGSGNVIHLFDIPNFIGKDKNCLSDLYKAFPGVKIIHLMKDTRNKKAYLAKLFIDCDKILDFFICLTETFEIIISQYSIIVFKEVNNGYAQLICTKWKQIISEIREEHDLIDLTNS
jgi:hypothetical protein